MRRIINFLHPDRPAWTWMPTLNGPLRPLWYVYRCWRNTFCPGTLRRHRWEEFEDDLGPSEYCIHCEEARFLPSG